MALTSKYDSRCKDCGVEYKAGESIDTNGNKSPNNQGVMKDHWCKMGKNCQGAMQLSTTPTRKAGEQMTNISKDPTPEQFLELGRMLLSGTPADADNMISKLTSETEIMIAQYAIKRSVIEEAMNKLGLKHPSRIAFIKDVLS
jgi:hypothetical protein